MSSNLSQAQIRQMIKTLSSSLTESPMFSEYGLEILQNTAHNRSPISQKDELKRFKALCVFFGDMKVSDITPDQINKWQNGLNLSSKTIRSYRGTLSTILKNSLSNGYCGDNPLTHTKPPRKENKEIVVFKDDEIKKILKSANGQFKNILEFNLFEGLRGSELIALKWSNINFKKSEIVINSRIRENEEDLPKGYKIRVIQLMPQAREALLNQWSLTGGGAYVFVTNKGTPYTSQDTLSKRLRKLCKDIRIAPRSFHTIRRTCNTIYKQNGLNSAWILQQLGHTEEVNQKHYTGSIMLNGEALEQFRELRF